jgi:hypothetical protein
VAQTSHPRHRPTSSIGVSAVKGGHELPAANDRF